MDATTAPAIEIEALSYRYDSGPLVLDNVSLSLEPHDFVSIIGPNGGGKTTLVKLVLGLLQPTSGHVWVFGTSPIRARERIGYMPQHAMMDPRFPIAVREVVLMGRLSPSRRIGRYSRQDRQAAAEALHRVGLTGFEGRPFSALSGGERQRVLLARALAASPDLLMLDEPAAGLDQKVEQDFFELLRDLRHQVTIVLVSHDLGFVSGFVEKVVCVHRTVDVHPTSAVNGRMISEIYGGEVRMVRHDHSLEP